MEIAVKTVARSSALRLWVLAMSVFLATTAAQTNAPHTAGCALRFAWIDYDKEPARYEDLANYLQTRLNCTVIPKQVRFYDPTVARQMNEDSSERIDLAFFTPLTYVKARDLNSGIEAMVSYYDSQRSPEYSSYLVWRDKKLDVSGVLDEMRKHREKKLILSNRNSTSGYVWPRSWLLNEKQFDVFEFGHEFGDSHKEVLTKLLTEPDAWAAALFSKTWDDYSKSHDVSDWGGH